MPMEYMNEEARRRAAEDKSAPRSSHCSTSLAEAIETVELWVDMWADDQAAIEEVSPCDIEERKVIAAVHVVLNAVKSKGAVPDAGDGYRLCSHKVAEELTVSKEKDATENLRALHGSSACPNCGEPYYTDRRNGSNKRAKCPECGKRGCTICVEMTETATCCCSPE